jgi:hypothetical protein
MKILCTLFIGILALILHETSAEAQNARSFVSSTGLESNPCNRTSPCRTFAGAIVKTNPGGEINTLDPAGYGPVTITKSISIVNGLGEAGVLVAPNGTGITISAGADDKINLRGLIIEGAAAGSTRNQIQQRQVLDHREQRRPEHDRQWHRIQSDRFEQPRNLQHPGFRQ